MRVLMVLTAAALLTGCVLDLRGTEWKKPGAMFQEVSAVEVECARKAFEIGPGPDLIVGGLLDEAGRAPRGGGPRRRGRHGARGDREGRGARHRRVPRKAPGAVHAATERGPPAFLSVVAAALVHPVVRLIAPA